MIKQFKLRKGQRKINATATIGERRPSTKSPKCKRQEHRDATTYRKLSPASYNVTVLSGWSLISSLSARKCPMKDFSQLRAISISFVRGSLFPKVTSIHTDSKCADSLKPAKPLCRQNFFHQNYTTRCTPRLQGEPIRITIWEILGMSASVLSTATHVISKTCT